jgi:hypothetical protein
MYIIQWITGLGWTVWVGQPGSKRRHIVTGFRSADLNHIMTWCGSCDVVILPAA